VERRLKTAVRTIEAFFEEVMRGYHNGYGWSRIVSMSVAAG
jgi:hypothetical protein